jgi:thymidylate kinase
MLSFASPDRLFALSVALCRAYQPFEATVLRLLEVDPMIIECFGPHGAGKSTFALALAAHLGAEGFKVSRSLSNRPSEEGYLPGENDAIDSEISFGATARRWIGPAFDALGAETSEARDNGSAVILASALPRAQVFRVFRMRQYLVRLSKTWAKAAQSDEIWIFDQAYIQAVLSIMMVQRQMAVSDVLALLSFVPHSDLAFHIATPVDVIEARSEQRRRYIAGVLGRLFQEQDRCVCKQFEIAKSIESLLTRSGRRVISKVSGNRRELEADVFAISSLIHQLRENP